MVDWNDGVCAEMSPAPTQAKLEWGTQMDSRCRGGQEDFGEGDNATEASVVRTRKTKVSWR